MCVCVCVCVCVCRLSAEGSEFGVVFGRGGFSGLMSSRASAGLSRPHERHVQPSAHHRESLLMREMHSLL